MDIAKRDKFDNIALLHDIDKKETSLLLLRYDTCSKRELYVFFTPPYKQNATQGQFLSGIESYMKI